MRPFGPDSRTGLELELLAPRGRSRSQLAEAIAFGISGSLQFGLKYFSEGERFEDGRPVCRLTPAVRVLDRDGDVFVTVVDDNTIKDELDGTAPPGAFVAVMDDVRLAKLAEEKSWSRNAGPAAALRGIAAVFDGAVEEGEGGLEAVDRYGHPLARVQPLGGERTRVAEVVTRPLRRDERSGALEAILSAAREVELTVPLEAALHLHLDRDPWMSTPSLRRLILGYSKDREVLAAEWRPNPRCRKLGPFPEAVQRVAREAEDSLPFDVFCAALKIAGVEKGLDLNLLGIVERYPLHPTLEVRALPMSLDAEELAAKVAAVERCLLQLFERG